MRVLLENIICVFYSFFRLCILKLINELFLGSSVLFSLVERISPGASIHSEKKSKVFLGKRFILHSGSRIRVRKSATLKIGDNVSFNYNCLIVCHNNITIGNGTIFGPSVYIYDHDHKYNKYKGKIERKIFISDPIVIGNNCWIGANVTILRGTVLGDNCIVGAGSILKGTYPPDSVIIQKR